VIRRLVVLLALVLSLGPAAAEKPRDLPLAPQAIEVRARPIASFRPSTPGERRFGALEWIGGLELRSSFRGFGGLSALAFLDGAGRRLLAASDAGIWLEAELTTEGERPTGLVNARMAPVRDENGRAVAGTWRGDSEAIAVRDGEAFVGFEASNQIRRFAIAREGITAGGTLFPAPAGVRELRRSRGLESLAAFPPGSRHQGALIAIAESPLRTETDHRAWIIGGPRPGQLALARRNDYDATDAAFEPGGDLLILERRVNPPFGIWCRIRRIPGTSIERGAIIDGRVIFEADLSHAIDNMEGLAVHRGADGATYLTLVSDDNYSLLQRTLLLRFRLVE
jgi:hypothetical protein